MVEIKSGIVALPEGNIQELLNLTDIPATKRRIGGKLMEHLIGKIFYVNLAVTGAVAQLYNIQITLTQ